MKTNILLSCSLVVLLTACGGSGTSAVDDIVVPELVTSEALSFAEMNALGASLYDANMGLINADDFTDAADIPTSGGVAMTGVINILAGDGNPVDADEGLIGQLDLVVDFGEASIEGVGSNFVNYSAAGIHTNAEGTLSLAAEIEDTFGTFAGTLSGELTDHDTVAFDVTIDGHFLGDQAEGVYGTGTGTFNTPGEGSGAVSVAIIAE